MAEISVIVPVYQVEAYLPRCIDSVLHQSYSDFQLILVDDGSPDSCGRICDEYAENDRRIHVIHQKNGGLSAARNAALDWMEENSPSRWLTFLDSDDWIHRDFLKRLLTAAEENGAELAYSQFLDVKEFREDPDPGPISPEILSPENAYADHYGACISACCCLLKRELYDGIRFPVGKLNEDSFVTHLVLFRAKKVVFLREFLYYYYTNPGSIMRGKWTPRHLDELEGHAIRRRFLKEKGLSRALEEEQRVTILTIYEQIQRLLAGDASQRKQYLGPLREKLRKEMKTGRKTVPLDAETMWIYLMTWHTLPIYYGLRALQDLWHRRKA